MNFKKIPIETIVVGGLLVFAGFLSNVFVLRGISFPVSKLIDPRIFLYSFFGGPYFKIPIYIIAIYFLIKAVLISISNSLRLLDIRSSGETESPVQYFFKNKDIWIDTGLTFIFIGLSLFLLSSSVGLLFVTAIPGDIIRVSNAIMSFDQAVFGKNFIFEFHNLLSNPVLERMILWSYNNIFTILSIIFFLLFFSVRKQNFRSFLMAFFICSIISLPISFFLPALAPQHIYNRNILSIEVPKEIKSGFESVTISPIFKNFLEKSDNYWIDKEQKSLAVTAFPSMHVAWGVIALIFAWYISPWLGLILFPWCVFNIIATVYAFQHYAIDSVVGIFIGIGAVMISNWLLKLEKRYYVGDRSEISLYPVIVGDLKKLRNIFRISS